ncbi:flagellar basal body P-ring formation chaperone FlgA [Lacunimicrobium album]
MSRSFTLLMMMAIIAGMTSAAMAIEIRLKDRVELPSDRAMITLGDIAEIRDEDPQRVEAWKAINIHPAPASGKEVLLDYTTITNRLQASGMTLVDADFRGSNRVAVRSGGAALQNMPGDANAARRQQVLNLLDTQLKKYASERMPQLGAFTFQVQASPEAYQALSMAVPGSLQMNLVSLDQTNKLFDAHIVFQDTRNMQGQVSIRLLLEPYPYVLVSQGMMQRGQIIRKEDLAWIQLTDQQLLNARNAGFQKDPAVLIGTEVMKTIRPQEPITGDQIRKSPLVRSNEIVTVTVNVASFAISRQFRARNDAAIGESVTLTTLDGKETLTATVSGYRTAVLSDDVAAKPTSGVRTADAQASEISLTSDLSSNTSQIPIINASSLSQTSASSATPTNFVPHSNQAHVIPNRIIPDRASMTRPEYR